MTNNFNNDEYGFGVFYNLEDLKVDEVDGGVINSDALYIVKLDPNNNVLGRFNDDGDEIPMDITVDELFEMRHGFLDNESVDEAVDEFYKELDKHYVYKCISQQTYWDPAEYIIVGLSEDGGIL